MKKNFALLPQAGGYLVSVFFTSTEQVTFSIDFAHRIQDTRRPRLRNNRVRLRFPSKSFSRQVADKLVENLRRLADDINAGRQRTRPMPRPTVCQADEQTTAACWPEADEMSSRVVMTRHGQRPGVAHVLGPKEIARDPMSLLPEWEIVLEGFGRALGDGWPDMAEQLARRLTPTIDDRLLKEAPTAQHLLF